jgi:hypothetical protein
MTIPQVPLIERAKLFGNPTRAQGRLSPDGRWLSWLAPRDGVMNLWLAPADALDEARPMTAETARPIGQYLWALDSRALLYVQDKGGDENFLLYRVDVESGAETCLTPLENTRVLIAGTSVTQRDRILVGLNNRNPQWHDVHELDLGTGTLTERMRGDGFAGFLADDSLALRIAIQPNADGGMNFHRVHGSDVEPDDAGRCADDPAGRLHDGWTDALLARQPRARHGGSGRGDGRRPADHRRGRAGGCRKRAHPSVDRRGAGLCGGVSHQGVGRPGCRDRRDARTASGAARGRHRGDVAHGR